MSMNLVWRVCGKVYEEFEYQTPTVLTNKVLATIDKKEQLILIRADLLRGVEDLETKEWKLGRLEDIKVKLYDTDYTLERI